ncbi:MAG: T9SS C-terminal target domain-containing protein [Bacteroidetes bacterium]|nr:MAG: T9SS C-terminal target domain-containing protein [Bacteroidota bacterium]
MTDDASDFSLFSFPLGTTINPNEYLVVWADKNLTQAGFHANFKLSAGGETILLTDSNLVIIDSITYGSQITDTSFGRLPNGTGNFVDMPHTIGARNSLTGLVSYDIAINEFLASNGSTQADQDGEFDDWIELYNYGTTPISLDGFRLSDDKSNFNLFSFPAGTVLNANDYIVIWADKDVSQAGFHANFKLSASGETIYLTDSSLTILDSISFTSQSTDTSYGRYPNGTGSFQTMNPTFNSANVIHSIVTGDIVINEFLASNSSTVADQNGEFDDWIELFNKGNTTVSLDNYSLSDDINNLKAFTFPIGTNLMADSFIVVWADGDTTQTGFHANFKLSASGESIYLTNSAMTIIDSVNFTTQVTDSSLGRYPNGTGNFQRMYPTFASKNIINTGIETIHNQSIQFGLYPNPANESFTIELSKSSTNNNVVSIYNNTGQLVFQSKINKHLTVNSTKWNSGIYFVRIGSSSAKIIVD